VIKLLILNHYKAITTWVFDEAEEMTDEDMFDK